MLGLSEYFKTYILTQTEQYQWLLQPLDKLKIQIHRIANFGCGEGRETLTLACMLKVSEAIGIDKDEQSIKNAQSTLKNIQDVIWAKGAPNNAPDFLRQTRLEDVVKFYPIDITNKSNDLPSNYFDFTFCHFVLYHIWLDQGGEDTTRRAIREMARIVKVGGVVAACEPTRRTGKSIFEINFKPLFEANGLKPIHVESKSYQDNIEDTEYLYIKEKTA
jgi:SAM-dependent methyltransferase